MRGGDPAGDRLVTSDSTEGVKVQLPVKPKPVGLRVILCVCMISEVPSQGPI